MKLRSHFFFVFVIGVLITASPAFAQKKWPGVVLYNIDYNGISKKLIVDPVVRISKGEFSYPVPIPPDTWDKANSHALLANYFDRFCREEYSKGRRLELYLDGNKAGSVKITGLDSMNSCSPVVSEVAASFLDTIKHPFMGHGLVISSLPSRNIIKHFPVDSVIQKSLYDYGKTEFLKHGVPNGVIGQMDIKDIRMVDIDGDGKPEYLATYFILGEEVKLGEIESNMQYSLTLVLKQDGNGYKQLFMHYPDPGTGEETHLYKLIDVIDIDGDGTCEIVIQQITSMTAWDYILLKKKGDIWVEVYEGAGGGC